MQEENINLASAIKESCYKISSENYQKLKNKEKFSKMERINQEASLKKMIIIIPVFKRLQYSNFTGNSF